MKKQLVRHKVTRKTKGGKTITYYRGKGAPHPDEKGGKSPAGKELADKKAEPSPDKTAEYEKRLKQLEAEKAHYDAQGSGSARILAKDLEGSIAELKRRIKAASSNPPHKEQIIKTKARIKELQKDKVGNRVAIGDQKMKLSNLREGLAKLNPKSTQKKNKKLLSRLTGSR